MDCDAEMSDNTPQRNWQNKQLQDLAATIDHPLELLDSDRPLSDSQRLELEVRLKLVRRIYLENLAKQVNRFDSLC